MWLPWLTLLLFVATTVLESRRAGSATEDARYLRGSPMEKTARSAKRSPFALALAMVAALLATSAVAACNTARGVGQDVGAVGEEIEDAVD